MKMHSYITVNGQLQYTEKQRKSTLVQLQAATESVGGWDKAKEVASTRQAEEQAKLAAASETAYSSTGEIEPTPIGTPSFPEGSSTSYVDAKTADTLRRRLVAISRGQSSGTSIPTLRSTPSYLSPHGPGNFSHFNNNTNVNELGSKDAPGLHAYIVEGDDHEDLKPHILVCHPDMKISALATEYSDLQSELISSGPNRVKWEDTITWKNFAVYQLIPTLVYELEYPRTDRSVLTFAILLH